MNKIIDGVYLFSGALSLQEQKLLALFYKSQKDKLYTPVLKSGHKMSLTMTQCGKHWNAKDYKYYNTRSDVDGGNIEPVPCEFIEIAQPFSKAAFPYHNPSWDILICNFYQPQKSKLGNHSDNSESKRALESGHPVVSFSLGASCVFNIDGQDLLLENGDVLLFGDKARLVKHGVKKVMKETTAEDNITELVDGGRVNFTLRKY